MDDESCIFVALSNSLLVVQIVKRCFVAVFCVDSISGRLRDDGIGFLCTIPVFLGRDVTKMRKCFARWCMFKEMNELWNEDPLAKRLRRL